MKKGLIIAALIAISVGMATAIPICLIALDHNPQGEFYGTDGEGYRWDSLGALFGSVTLFVGTIAFIPLGCLAMVRRHFLRTRSV